MTLVIDSKRRDAPTPNDSARPKPRHRSLKLPIGQTFDASHDFRVEPRRGGWTAVAEVCDGLNDVSDRLFGCR
jgi:hypothetical protein